MEEYDADPAARFEVRVVDAETLAELTGYAGTPQEIVVRVERELIGQQTATFAPWNGRRRSRSGARQPQHPSGAI